ncbi:MAG: hypothetical protein AAF203_09375, partial [Pseudomonadota bacterium]
MKRPWFLILIPLSFLGCVTTTDSVPTNVKATSPNMTLQRILPFVYNESLFKGQNNRRWLSQSIEDFKNSVHDLSDSEKDRYFGQNKIQQNSFENLKEQISRARFFYDKDRYETSRILLKTAVRQCYSCHLSPAMKSSSAYWDAFSLKKLKTDELEKADIFVSMGRPAEAKLVLKNFLRNSENRGRFDENYKKALRYYLMLSIHKPQSYQSAVHFIDAKLILS